MTRNSWMGFSMTLALAALLALGLGGTAAASDPKAAAGHGEEAAHGGHDAASSMNWFNLDYKALDGKGEKLEPGGHAMAPPFGLALMNFGAFFFLLVWKGGPPLTGYLRGRHNSIKEALEEGQRLRDEATSKLEEYSTKIKGVEAEVDALIAEVRSSAEGEKQRIIAEAERSAELMKKSAEAQIAAEISRARADLEAEVMRAAIAATEKILREKATAADHQKLIDTFLVDVAASGATSSQGTLS